VKFNLIEFEEITDELFIAIGQHLDLYNNENKEIQMKHKIAINISSFSENPKLLQILSLKQFKMQMNINERMYCITNPSFNINFNCC
jgi:hypothetical protein